MNSLSLLSIAVLFSFLPILQPPKFSITVDVENAESNSGKLLLVLYAKKEGFPQDFQKGLMHCNIPLTERAGTAVFNGLPPGEYAVAVLHDENDNGKMDTNFFGLPKEAYGVSNNPKHHFSPPKYKDAVFEVNGNKRIGIRLKRLL